MNCIKKINIKNCTYYLFDEMINIKNFDPDQITIDKKYIIIYYIPIENLSYVKINSVTPLYFIIDKVDGYIEKAMEINI